MFTRFLYVESCGQCPPCKLGSGDIAQILERFEAGLGEPGDLDVLLARARSVTDGQKCALPTGTSLVAQSLLQVFAEEFGAHVRRRCPRHRGLLVPRLVDFDADARRFVYDEAYPRRRPDWTYAA